MGPVSAESTTRLQSVADRMLVERAVQNDAEAFGELVRRHSSLMRAYVYRIVGSLADTDDVVQDAFVIAWKQLPTLRDASAVKAWLMRIAGREALAFVGRRPAEAVLDDYSFSAPRTTQPEQTAIRNAQLRALSGALDKLKEDQRRSWLLREIADCSYDEIAELMDIPPSTVRGLLSRARASIAIEMEGWR
ncbi:RNA polymerase sigma factor [Microbacterium sp.]|uniref:RNA polymerase sigma factor n=1 Tax=Microbacterium sp. TaxID=51671 RepID=UPI003F6FD475